MNVCTYFEHNEIKLSIFYDKNVESFAWLCVKYAWKLFLEKKNWKLSVKKAKTEKLQRILKTIRCINKNRSILIRWCIKNFYVAIDTTCYQ